MRLAWLALALGGVACGSANLKGPRYAPSAVRELASLPPGFEAGEELRATCLLPLGSTVIDDQSLGDLDCNFERLSRVIRARAGETSAAFIVGKDCQIEIGAGLACTARVARPTERAPHANISAAAGPAPSPAQVLDLDDPRPQDTERIRVSFEPDREGSSSRLPARTYDRVDETSLPPVGRRALGRVSARCDAGCSAASLRYALRVTAGRVGAGEVSHVQCVTESDGLRCDATAFVPWSS